MAVLKAFVCQIVLLGLYKLFLEQVVEEYLVPDELTRNCLVGLVILLCFGIQLYTDKPGDDNDEAEEDPKAKSKSRESQGVKKFESAEISGTHEIATETVGLNGSSHVMITKTQTTLQEIATEKKQSSKSQHDVDSKEGHSAIPSTEAEKVAKISHSTIFDEFSTNKPDDVEEFASTAQASHEQETKTIPLLNGLSEVDVSEESDEEGIEIDQFVSKESSEEAEQLMTVESVEVETIKPEHKTEPIMESECLTSNGVNISSTQDLDSDPMIDESVSLITNGTEVESFNNIDEMPSNIIEELERRNSVKDGNELRDGQEMTSRDSSKPNTCTKDFTESLPSVQDKDCASTISTKTVDEVEAVNENGAETSTVVKATAVSPRRKITADESVYATPISIDISFIYACH